MNREALVKASYATDFGGFGHEADLGDQKGSPPGRYSIGTSGMNVFNHWAHSFIPRSSDGT
jgi:hypothetical protein